MRKSIFLLICIPLSLFSQVDDSVNYQMVMSQFFEVGYTSQPLYAHSNNKLLIAAKAGDSIFLRLFDEKDLNLISQHSYAAFPKKMGFKGILSIQKILNRDFLFYFFEDPQQDIQDLFMQEIDVEKGIFIEEARKIFVLKHSNTFNKVSITPDKNRNRFLVHYKRMIKYENDPTYYFEYNLIVFDAVGNIINGYIYVPKFGIKNTQENCTALDSKGNIHLIINKKNKSRKQNTFFEHVVIPLNGDQIIVLNEEGVAPFTDTDILFEQENGQLLLAGLYSEKEKNGRNGFYCIEFNANNKIAGKTLIDIPLNCINSYSKLKDRNKNIKLEASGENYAVESLVLREVIPTADSSYLFIAEVYEEPKSDLPTFKYKDLYLAKMEADHKLAWTTKIPKQQSENASFGYRYIPNGEDHLFVFNDHKANMELKDGFYAHPIKDHKEGVLVGYNVSNLDGKSTKKILIDFSNYDEYTLGNIKVSSIFAIEGVGFYFMNTSEGGFLVFGVKFDD
jgi:hypothetical protein